MDKIELKDEELEKVSGGRVFTLTDEMIKQGEYFIGQADVIHYNGQDYYDLHHSITINHIDMFEYRSSTGATLLIPFNNYS